MPDDLKDGPVTPNEREALAPCPWVDCPRSWPRVIVYGSVQNGRRLAVACQGCGAQGPWQNNEPLATEAWNSLPREALLAEGRRLGLLEAEGAVKSVFDGFVREAWLSRAEGVRQALRAVRAAMVVAPALPEEMLAIIRDPRIPLAGEARAALAKLPSESTWTDYLRRVTVAEAALSRVRRALEETPETIAAIGAIIEMIEGVGPWDDVAGSILANLRTSAGLDPAASQEGTQGSGEVDRG